MLNRRKNVPPVTLEPLPDGLPKSGLFAEPIRVSRLTASDEQHGEDKVRVTFLVEVRDAEDRRCSDLFVEALVRSPERERIVSGTTDLLGRIRFRIVGVPGAYLATITNVGAFGLRWDDKQDDVTVHHHVTERSEQ